MAEITRPASTLSQTESELSAEESAVLQKVLQALRQIRYGQIQITIQDGRVVQLDRTEKQRFS
jgi:hypothetical protein